MARAPRPPVGFFFFSTPDPHLIRQKNAAVLLPDIRGTGRNGVTSALRRCYAFKPLNLLRELVAVTV